MFNSSTDDCPGSVILELSAKASLAAELADQAWFGKIFKNYGPG